MSQGVELFFLVLVRSFGFGFFLVLVLFREVVCCFFQNVWKFEGFYDRFMMLNDSLMV